MKEDIEVVKGVIEELEEEISSMDNMKEQMKRSVENLNGEVKARKLDLIMTAEKIVIKKKRLIEALENIIQRMEDLYE